MAFLISTIEAVRFTSNVLQSFSKFSSFLGFLCYLIHLFALVSRIRYKDYGWLELPMRAPSWPAMLVIILFHLAMF
jgi:hypothetical protein